MAPIGISYLRSEKVVHSCEAVKIHESLPVETYVMSHNMKAQPFPHSCSGDVGGHGHYNCSAILIHQLQVISLKTAIGIPTATDIGDRSRQLENVKGSRSP